MVLRTAVDLAPKSASAHNQLGLILSAQRNHQGAIQSFKKALAIDPNHRAAKENLETLQDNPRFTPLMD